MTVTDYVGSTKVITCTPARAVEITSSNYYSTLLPEPLARISWS